MQIETGLFPHMVLQRTEANGCDVVIRGTCQSSGTLKAGIKGKTLTLGRAGRGRFQGRLRGLKTGGPYRIELRIEDKSGRVLERCVVVDVLVGDVWLLGGQSNMQGCGDYVDRHRGHAKVRACYMDDRWAKAVDPLHNLWDAVDSCHEILAGAKPLKPVKFIKDVGPGVAFGVRMFERTSVPQGLIPCAHGGTSMSQWDPHLHERNGQNTLFSAMIRRARKSGGYAAGLLWYQGESDAAPGTAAQYTVRMKQFVAALRRQVGHRGRGKLPVALVQLARFAGTDGFTAWNSIQNQQRRLAKLIDRLTVVPAVDLELGDLIHLNGKSQQILGRRLAEAMHTLRRGAKAQPPPIELRRISAKAHGAGVFQINAEFDHVVGKLTSLGRPTGFQLGGQGVFDIQLHGHVVRLLTMNWTSSLVQDQLQYGPGCNPYCNITDQAGRPLPVFGPEPVGESGALTPFLQKLQVSKALPSAGKLHDLAFPADRPALALQTRDFAAGFVSNFCNLHEDIIKAEDPDPMYVLACRLRCETPMKLAARLGYDGPVKAWFDGREIFHDPEGVNPALPDAAVVRFQADAGDHELLIALGSNQKHAWGLFLRLQRLDISKRQLLEGPGSYAMPVLLD